MTFKFTFSFSCCITKRNKSSKCKRTESVLSALNYLSLRFWFRVYWDWPNLLYMGFILNIQKYYFYILLCSTVSVTIIISKICHHIIHIYERVEQFFKYLSKQHITYSYIKYLRKSPSLKQTIKALKLYSDRLGRPHSQCRIGFSMIISGQ